MFSYKSCISTVVLSVFLSAVNTVYGADSTRIENLIKKAAGAKKAPSSSEIAVIEGFIKEAMDEILASTDLSEAINARLQILSFRGDSEDLSLYTRSYILAARDSLNKAFSTVEKWPDPVGKLHTQRNLMILTAQLGSIELRDIGLKMLNHKDCTVRYWAVKSIAGDRIASQLNSPLTGDAEIKATIVKKLQDHLDNENRPEIIGLIGRFAGLLEGPEGIGLLNKIADVRIAAYSRWGVQYELVDADILNSMASAIVSMPAGSGRNQAATRFAQLYSYMIQRFIITADTIKETAKERQVSAIASVESQGVTALFGGKPVKDIVTALQKNDISILQRAHDALLGTGSGRGALETKLNFDASLKKLNPPPANVK